MDLLIKKIMQKAGEFGDADLANEALVKELIKNNFDKLKNKQEIIKILNEVSEAKKKAQMSKKSPS